MHCLFQNCDCPAQELSDCGQAYTENGGDLAVSKAVSTQMQARLLLPRKPANRCIQAQGCFAIKKRLFRRALRVWFRAHPAGNIFLTGGWTVTPPSPLIERQTRGHGEKPGANIFNLRAKQPCAW